MAAEALMGFPKAQNETTVGMLTDTEVETETEAATLVVVVGILLGLYPQVKVAAAPLIETDRQQKFELTATHGASWPAPPVQVPIVVVF